MSVDEVLCQISTFLAAGHETTASALTWCLYALARDAECQNKLREAFRDVAEAHLLAKAGSEGLVDGILRCEYLEWVVRESLRLHSPVTNTMRVCMRDTDNVPVSPSGFVDRDGTQRWNILVKKGDIISVPIQAINKVEPLWGAEALEFRYVFHCFDLLIMHLLCGDRSTPKFLMFHVAVLYTSTKANCMH